MNATGLPDGTRFDGPMNALGVTLMGFTDFAQTGDTFYLLPAEATPERIAQEVDQRRATYVPPPEDLDVALQFLCEVGSPLVPPPDAEPPASTEPLPPVYQRAPRIYAGPETNHY